MDIIGDMINTNNAIPAIICQRIIFLCTLSLINCFVNVVFTITPSLITRYVAITSKNANAVSKANMTDIIVVIK